eukprot:4615282-Prymnesium_polylepis.1
MPPMTAPSAPASHAACLRPDAAASVPGQMLPSAPHPCCCTAALAACARIARGLLPPQRRSVRTEAD